MDVATRTPDLQDAREALAYWEGRARALPRWALRRRREAHAMARRWHARVAEAEAATYGRGLLGALALAATERRLPERARHTGRQVARRTKQAAAAAVVAALSLVALAAVATVELLATLARALG
jgi:hypothetical protein